jgi:hypothetical protein
MILRAVLEGGPFAETELALISGHAPSYMLLIVSPASEYPIVVGADFDDAWPGQQRYELTDERLDELDGGYMPTMVYTHVES